MSAASTIWSICRQRGSWFGTICLQCPSANLRSGYISVNWGPEEVANVPARLVSITLRSSLQSRKVPNGWKKGKCHTCLWDRQEKQPGELQARQLYLSPWESWEANSPAISKHMEDKKASGNSQHRFTKGKSCWESWLPSVTWWLAWWVGEEQWMLFHLASARPFTWSPIVSLQPNWWNTNRSSWLQDG